MQGSSQHGYTKQPNTSLLARIDLKDHHNMVIRDNPTPLYCLEQNLNIITTRLYKTTWYHYVFFGFKHLDDSHYQWIGYALNQTNMRLHSWLSSRETIDMEGLWFCLYDHSVHLFINNNTIVGKMRPTNTWMTEKNWWRWEEWEFRDRLDSKRSNELSHD